MGIAGHQQLRDQTRPTCLMRGSDASACIAMEVFVEEQVIPEMRVGLHAGVMTECRPAAGPIGQEYPR
jgi:hypothetical protein